MNIEEALHHAAVEQQLDEALGALAKWIEVTWDA